MMVPDHLGLLSHMLMFEFLKFLFCVFQLRTIRNPHHSVSQTRRPDSTSVMSTARDHRQLYQTGRGPHHPPSLCSVLELQTATAVPGGGAVPPSSVHQGHLQPDLTSASAAENQTAEEALSLRGANIHHERHQAPPPSGAL